MKMKLRAILSVMIVLTVLMTSLIASGGKTYFDYLQVSPEMGLNAEGRPFVYEADTKAKSDFICNAVVLDNGDVIAARSGGRIVRIDANGNEQMLLSIPGATDWRGLWVSAKGDVFASPFDCVGQGEKIAIGGYGIYRLKRGAERFDKVFDLPKGDMIWTFCEDDNGNLFAGNYTLSGYRPIIYRSVDGGAEWKKIFDFNEAQYTQNGRHIHSVIWNRYNSALYAIVGEINTVFKSADGGVTWRDLNVHLVVKGSAMLATPHGVLIGSDGPYNCDIDLLLPDDKTHRRVSRIWANTVFGLRESDVTGNIYAFCKIDISAKKERFMPQFDVNDKAALDGYLSSHANTDWSSYYESVKDYYPNDAIRPQHWAILMSRDQGLTWQVVYKGRAGAVNNDGLWTVGYFKNGEILAGHVASTSSISNGFVHPLVLSEGKHAFVKEGWDLSMEIFGRTLENPIVMPLAGSH